MDGNSRKADHVDNFGHGWRLASSSSCLQLISALNMSRPPQWGGFLMTLVIAITGIVASLPIGIALALGRRSNMPIVKLLSIIFIEFWRGVPLITVLFMSSVLLPLFLPDGVNFRQTAACADRCRAVLGSLYGRGGSRWFAGHSQGPV